MQFVEFDDLNRGLQALLYAVGEGLAGATAIDEHAFHSIEIGFERSNTCKALLRSVTSAVTYGDGMGQPLRVNRDETLDAGHFLARVVSLVFRPVDVLHALGINDQKTGHNVSPLLDADIANLIFWLGPER